MLMPKNSEVLKKTAIAAVSIILIGLVIGLAVRLANYQTSKPVVSVSSQSCQGGNHHHYVVNIKDDKAVPQHTNAKYCDSLTIVNLDSTQRLMAFGKHEHHIKYDGIEERLLSQNQQLTVTLVQTGNFLFHDHLHDEVQGSFTVSK